MSEKTFRVATTLEVQHYRELLQPINDFLAETGASRDDMPVELIQITQGVFAELARFGYVPTAEVLLVGMEAEEMALDDPGLDNAQAAAVLRDVQRVFARMRRPWS